MASVDHGATVQIDIEPLINNAQGFLGLPPASPGFYNRFTFTQSGNNQVGSDHGATFNPAASELSPSTLPRPPGSTVYYQMCGFYATGNVEESFVTLNAPSTSTVVNPNTGHTLTDTRVITTWRV